MAYSLLLAPASLLGGGLGLFAYASVTYFETDWLKLQGLATASTTL
jgi:hypothetical protein